MKNPDALEQGRIRFHDIGDYLSRDEKLAAIAKFGSIGGIQNVDGWRTIVPDGHGDWLRQRDANFSTLLALGDKKGSQRSVFTTYSLGIASGRDSWAFNPSKEVVARNMSILVAFYNEELDRLDSKHPQADRAERASLVDDFVRAEPTRISWTRALKADLVKGKRLAFAADRITASMYRPFTRRWLYYDRKLNEMVYKVPQIFPFEGGDNLVICIAGPGSISGFTALMTDMIPELCLATVKGGTQMFRVTFMRTWRRRTTMVHKPTSWSRVTQDLAACDG